MLPLGSRMITCRLSQTCLLGAWSMAAVAVFTLLAGLKEFQLSDDVGNGAVGDSAPVGPAVRPM